MHPRAVTGFERRRDCVQTVFPARRENEIEPVGGEHLRERAADASRRSSDERGAPFSRHREKTSSRSACSAFCSSPRAPAPLRRRRAEQAEAAEADFNAEIAALADGPGSRTSPPYAYQRS